MNEAQVGAFVEKGGGRREKGLPAVAVSFGAEAGEGGEEAAGVPAMVLDAPEVDLLELVEVRRQALEVERDAVVGGRKVGAAMRIGLSETKASAPRRRPATKLLGCGFFLPSQK